MKRKARKDIEDTLENAYYKDIHKDPPKKRVKVAKLLPPKPKEVVSVEKLCDLLNNAYEPAKLCDINPVDCLVRTVLSQNTRDVSSRKAYEVCLLYLYTFLIFC